MALTFLFLLIGFSGANELDKDLKATEVTRICSLLLSANRTTVRLAAGRVQTLDARSRFYISQLPDKMRNLAEILSTLPFGKKLIDEVPELAEYSWEQTHSTACSGFFTAKKNEVILRLQLHGYFDIKIGPSLDSEADRALYERIVAVLFSCGSKVVVFATPIADPASTDSQEYALWITHVDPGEPDGRRCLRQILAQLEN